MDSNDYFDYYLIDDLLSTELIFHIHLFRQGCQFFKKGLN